MLEVTENERFPQESENGLMRQQKERKICVERKRKIYEERKENFE